MPGSTTAATTPFDAPFLVPYRGYAPYIQYYKFDGNADYHSLQVSVQRRFSKGLTFGAAYTYSRSRTTANADEDQEDAFDTRRYDYRLAWWDRPHVLVFNYVYDIPSLAKKFGGPKWLGYITDNFQLSGITTFESGSPIDTGLWWVPAMTISGTYNADAINWSRAYVYPTISSDVDQEVGTSKFNPAAFTPPPVGVPPTPSRDGLRTGGLQNWDMSLFKNFPLGGGRSLPAAPVRGVQRVQPPELQHRESELAGESADGRGANDADHQHAPGGRHGEVQQLLR